MTKNDDSRKSTANIASKDTTPKAAPEEQLDPVVNPKAVKGTEDQAKSGSTEDKLASAIKSQGVDKVEVWKGDDNGLLYARMQQDGVTRLLSVDEEEAEDDTTATAKSVVARAGF